MWSFLSLLLAGTVQVPAAQFEIALWPGEGRPVFRSVATELVLREHPSSDAKVVDRVRIGRDKPVPFEATVYRTVKPGRLRALKQTQITGRRMGGIVRLSRDDYYSGKFPKGVVIVPAGEAIDFLQHRAEGTCFVRVREEVLDAERCPADDAAAFAVESKPELEWWIEVAFNGSRRGWLFVHPSVVRQVRRVGLPGHEQVGAADAGTSAVFSPVPEQAR